MKKYKSPSSRHYPERVSHPKKLNTMILIPTKDILDDVNEINETGESLAHGDTIITSSGRTYGIEKPKNHWRVYPMGGPGLLTINKKQYVVLRHFRKCGVDSGLDFLTKLLSPRKEFTEEMADQVVDLAIYAGF